MAYWAGGGASGWSGDGLPGGRPRSRSGRIDGWDYEELGKIYDFPLLARLGPFFSPYKVRAVIAVTMMVIASVTSYVQPFLMGKGVERLVSNLRAGTPESLAAATADVRDFGALLVGISVLSFVATYIQRRMTGYMGHGLLKNLRSKMFDHLNRLSLSFYDNQEVGRVMSRVTSDVVTLQELMTTGFLNVLADLVGLALVVFFLLALDVQLGLISLSVIPVLMVFLAFWQGYAARAFIRTRIAIAVVNSNLNENVSGVRVVQSLRRERENLAHFARLNRENLEANLDAARQQAIVMPVVEVLSSLATVLVLIVIGVRTFNGDLEPSKALGFSTAFLLYIQRVFNPVRDIVMQYTQLQRAMAGARRIFEVLDTQPEIEDIPDAIVLPDVRGRVDFNHVQFEYVPGVPVLRDFDLHVEPGETVALVGHTGAGKTSVTALVNRSYEITGGQILIDGVDLAIIERASLTSRMSVVLQEPYLFSGTVRENIRYGKLDASDEQMRAAARAVGADEFIEALPSGYDTMLQERGKNLSIGQRQLISFARAIIADPRILILDEATANVDTHTERLIQQALATMLKGRTSFVIAHRLSTIRSADRIVVMQAGRIVETGPHDALLAQDGIYADLYRMTFAGILADEG